MGAVILKFGGSMRFVFDLESNDIYTQRFVASDIMKGSLIGYALTYLAGCFLPLVMSWGLYYKKKLVTLFGLICYLILFSVGSNKSYIVSPFLILTVFYSFQSKKTFFRSTFFTITLVTLFLTYSQTLAPLTVKLLFFIPASFFLFRTLMVGAYSTVKYYNFFLDHPLLYYSHIKGFNLFIPYPYDNPVIGQVIGDFYSGNPRYNINTNFWITDGLASSWYLGIVLVSVFVAILFYFLDCSTKNLDIKYVLPVLAYSSVNLTNWSISTTIISGGLGLLLFIFLLHPRQNLNMDN